MNVSFSAPTSKNSSTPSLQTVLSWAVEAHKIGYQREARAQYEEAIGKAGSVAECLEVVGAARAALDGFSRASYETTAKTAKLALRKALGMVANADEAGAVFEAANEMVKMLAFDAGAGGEAYYWHPFQAHAFRSLARDAYAKQCAFRRKAPTGYNTVDSFG